MSKVSSDQWSQLLIKAARDTKFRKQLTEEPKAAARSVNIELDAESLKMLKPVLEKIVEVGLNTRLDEAVAKQWHVLVFHSPHTSGITAPITEPVTKPKRKKKK